MSVQNHGGHAGKAPAGTGTYTDLNARIIDSWIAEGWEWGTPIPHERYLTALEGDWTMGVGKTATARCLRDLLPHAARVIAGLAPAAR